MVILSYYCLNNHSYRIHLVSHVLQYFSSLKHVKMAGIGGPPVAHLFLVNLGLHEVAYPIMQWEGWQEGVGTSGLNLKPV